MSKVVKEVIVISNVLRTKLNNAFKAWNKKGREKLLAGVKLGLLMNETIKNFINAGTGTSEQTCRTKAGKFLTDEIGISKTHRNLLLQIVNFNGMLKMIDDGKINSISEAKDFMSPSKNESNANESDEEGGEGEGKGEPTSKDADKVLSILKQLDKLGINGKGITNQIIKNAQKVLEIEVKYESNAETA